jgi:predicted DNA-binding ArsR family transcriptional regulator
MKKVLLSLSVFIITAQSLFSQIPIGTWRDHLPYYKVIAVAESPTRMYAATPNGLFYVDYTDFTINRLSKINGLSDVGVTAIAFNSAQNTLIVGYKNSNIDLIKNDEIINLPDLKRSLIPGNKTINRIKCDQNIAYLACGFGVIAIDVRRNEIKETWQVGNLGDYLNINDVEVFNDSIYLATDQGIKYAPKASPNLANYQSWTAETDTFFTNKRVKDIEKVGGKLMAHISIADSSYLYLYTASNWSPITLFNDSKKYSLECAGNRLALTFNSGNVLIYDTNFTQLFWLFTYNPGFVDPNFARFDRKGDLWVCDNQKGLVWVNGKNFWDCKIQQVMGPNLSDIWQVFGNDKKMVIVGGAVDDSYTNLWRSSQFSCFSGEVWSAYNRSNNPAIDSLYDVVSGVVDPSNEQSVWLSSWGKGLIHLQSDKIVEVLDGHNSSLENNVNNSTWVYGTGFDKDNNLWVLNSAVSKPLKVKTPANQWYSFSLSPYANNYKLSKLAIDSSGYKWILLPLNNGIVVYNDNGTLSNTSDDQIKLLNINLGTRVSSNYINCFAEDLNGDMWVGTDKGIKVFYGISNIFSTTNPAPQTILIEQDGYVQNLLEFENVTDIVVDGANRKWIGTSKAGLFVISSDGTTELAHYTIENSSLFSDEITSLALNQKNGELFIGTTMGLISFRTDATLGSETIVKSDVLVFPNPVHPDYNGEIAIKGLTTNANIKITNANGVLVYQTIANGGEAIWNGKNFSGEKVATGVYLVFSSNEDGSQHVVAKLLFVK